MSKSKIKSADLGDLPPGQYGMKGGLLFRVTAGKTGVGRNWILRFTLNGKPDNMGLGKWPDVPDVVARQRADEYRHLAKQGINPKADRDARAETVKAKEMATEAAALKTITFKEMAEEWFDAYRDEWSDRSKTEKDYRATLSRYAYPLLGALPVREIDADLVLQVLKPIWKMLKKADRVRNVIERILEMATAHKYREGENPARWGLLHHLGLPSPHLIHKTKNLVALPHDQIPAFMAKLRSVDSRDARALELAILCGGRTDEARSARWTEFDFEKRLWIIPAIRTKTGKKTGKDHEVPLSDRAMEIVNVRPRISDYVFPGRHRNNRRLNVAIPIGIKAMRRQLLAICNYCDRDGDPVTVHGFRSSFNDWAGDCTEFDRDTIQMQLSHKVGNTVELAYRRGKALEKRRSLVEAWSDYCMGRSNIVPDAV
jgi:integrase